MSDDKNVDDAPREPDDVCDKCGWVNNLDLRLRCRNCGKVLTQSRAKFDVKRFEQAPCYLCDYNSEGYYQPDTHPCAALYHRHRGIKIEASGESLESTIAWIASKLMAGGITGAEDLGTIKVGIDRLLGKVGDRDASLDAYRKLHREQQQRIEELQAHNRRLIETTSAAQQQLLKAGLLVFPEGIEDGIKTAIEQIESWKKKHALAIEMGEAAYQRTMDKVKRMRAEAAGVEQVEVASKARPEQLSNDEFETWFEEHAEAAFWHFDTVIKKGILVPMGEGAPPTVRSVSDRDAFKQAIRNVARQARVRTDRLFEQSGLVGLLRTTALELGGLVDAEYGKIRNGAKSPLWMAAHILARVRELLKPVAVQIWCPLCGTKHIDKGEFTTREHKSHTCQNKACGLTWMTSLRPTVGVQFLPGTENDPEKTDG